MTKINDYLWHLPHTPTPDDPRDVTTLQQMFNQPIMDILTEPLAEHGYTLSVSDVLVPPDKLVLQSELANVYKANVRFAHYLDDLTIARVHFEHDEWAERLPGADEHVFTITLDRYRVTDRSTMVAEPNWPGRLLTKVSSVPGDALHYTGRDQLWRYNSGEQLAAHLALFLRKFEAAGLGWLHDRASL